MSKRLLLQSVLFVSTVAPVMSSYAIDTLPSQNSGVVTQVSKKAIGSSEDSTSSMQNPLNTTKENATGQNTRSNTLKNEDPEEMD